MKYGVFFFFCLFWWVFFFFLFHILIFNSFLFFLVFKKLSLILQNSKVLLLCMFHLRSFLRPKSKYFTIFFNSFSWVIPKFYMNISLSSHHCVQSLDVQLFSSSFLGMIIYYVFPAVLTRAWHEGVQLNFFVFKKLIHYKLCYPFFLTISLAGLHHSILQSQWPSSQWTSSPSWTSWLSHSLMVN